MRVKPERKGTMPDHPRARCPSTSPHGVPCGLAAGHDGGHTSAVEPGAPWARKPEADPIRLAGRGVCAAEIEAAMARAPAPPAELLGMPSPVPLDLGSPLALPPDRYAGMNAGERRYAERVLDPSLRAGMVLYWGFEAIKLKLAPQCFYTPDFLVVGKDLEISLREVKGRKGKSWWAREDARIKLRLAAHLFPFKLVVVWPLKGGGWGEEVIGRARQGEGSS